MGAAMKNFYITETLAVEGGGEDAVELEVETEVEVEYHIEPAQHGGREDPSWAAHAVIEEVTRSHDLWIGGVMVYRRGSHVAISHLDEHRIAEEIIEWLGEP